MKKLFELYFLYTFLVLPVLSNPNKVEGTQNILNRFSLEFYKEATNKNANKNLVMSPLSAEILLGLLSTGARGDSQKEIHDAIHLPNSEIIKSTFRSTISKHNSIPDVVLNVANKIYVKKGDAFELGPDFKSVAKDQFDSNIENIDFSNNEQAATTINEWVESKTNNKIKDFINPKNLDPNTRAMLVNAIYFQGNWAKPFDKRFVQKEKFYKNEVDHIDIDMMYQTDKFPYVYLPDWDSSILSLPYKNNNTYLTIFLPRLVDGLEGLEEKIYSANIADVLSKMTKTRVAVGIPKFKIESTIDLKDVLPELGIKRIFSMRKADLYYLLKSHEKLYISDATQKAFIEVNEHGTEAGVVTEIRPMPVSRIPMFIASHPFFYMLMNKDDIIFCGKYIGA